MTTSLQEMENILEKNRSRPRGTIVEELVELGDVDSLAKLRLKIVSKCRENESFSKGGQVSIVDEGRKGRVCFRLLKNGWQVNFWRLGTVQAKSRTFLKLRGEHCM